MTRLTDPEPPTVPCLVRGHAVPPPVVAAFRPDAPSAGIALSGIAVHVIDADDATRRSLPRLIGPAGYRVSGFSSAEAFLSRAAGLAPGPVLIDLRLPGGLDGLACQRLMAERGLPLPVILMAGPADLRAAVQAMRAGAVDVIGKPLDPGDLLSALREAEARLPAPRQETARSRMAELTPRERDVLRLLIEGRPNKAVGQDLGISPRTVEVHRARIMDKVGATSFPELVRIALAAGFGA